jgi:hypothetical protein
MVAYKDLPDTLKPYAFHGLNLNYSPKEKYAMGDCPWCTRENKFGVKVESGVWKCWVCADGAKTGGNATTFVKRLWQQCAEKTTDKQLQAYATDKGFAGVEALRAWGLAWSPYVNRWIVPGYGLNLSIATLYMLSPFKKKDGTPYQRWIPTPSLGMKIYGLGAFVIGKPLVYICEGFNDGCILYETLGACKVGGDTLVPLQDGETLADSMLKEANVIAIPGCEQWQDSWNRLIEGAEVRLMFDNDHPIKVENQADKPPAGYSGTLRTAGLLYHGKLKVNSVEALVWGPDGFEESLPDGHDVRDFLRSNS